ncbi:MAG TPA: hypothetical protein VF245_06905 [Solirubrobacterales bacterium]
MAEAAVETADVLAIDAAIARQTGSGEYGLTESGFVPNPFARLLAEKLALARALLGDDLDLGSGSVLRKLLEVAALEDARTWAALASMYDDLFVGSATGAALSDLGEQLGLSRPQLCASGSVALTLQGPVPGAAALELPRGARLLSPGGRHAALAERVVLSAATPAREAGVAAFYPGPAGNLDPFQPEQKLDRLNPEDPKLVDLLALEAEASETGKPFTVKVDQTAPLSGGELQWSDARYRELLLRAPRSVWTAEAIQIATELVPGVRRAQVRDLWGGLDVDQSLFGDFDFFERVFAAERDIASPYYVTILVAPTAAAIWSGPGGLEDSVRAAIEDLRPIGIFPRIEQAQRVSVGVSCKLAVEGVPLPGGSQAAVNGSQPALALKRRLLDRVRRHVERLGFGEPVRAAEVAWALMNEPGVVDVRELTLLRYPPGLAEAEELEGAQPDSFACGANVELQANQVPVLVEDEERLWLL